MDTIVWAYRAAVIIGALLGVEFLISYHIKSGGSWIKTDGGKINMKLMGALALVFTVVNLRILSNVVIKSAVFDSITYVLGFTGLLAVIAAMFSNRRLMGRLQRESAERQRQGVLMSISVPVVRADEANTQMVPIFGREPALIIVTLASLLSLVVALGIPGFNDTTVTAINSVIFFAMGAFAAIKTRPFQPMAIVALVGPIVQLVAAYGFQIDPAVTTAVQASVLTVLQFVIRAQVTPASNPLPTTPAIGPVA